MPMINAFRAALSLMILCALITTEGGDPKFGMNRISSNVWRQKKPG